MRALAYVSALIASALGGARAEEARHSERAKSIALDLKNFFRRGRGSGGGGMTMKRLRKKFRESRCERFAIGGTPDDKRAMRNARKLERQATR